MEIGKEAVKTQKTGTVSHIYYGKAVPVAADRLFKFARPILYFVVTLFALDQLE